MKRSLLTLALVALICAGCDHLPRAKAPIECQVFDRYDQVQLGCTSTSDVLVKIKKVNLNEKLSQGENVIASWGQKGNFAALWLNMVAFDEDKMTAKRKYSLVLDEDSPGYEFLFKPSKNFRMDIDMILDDGTLTEAYTDEKAKRIAVVNRLKELFSEDVRQVVADSQSIDSTAMFVNNMFFRLQEQLTRTPALAQDLTSVKGMSFDHEHFGPAKMRLVICDNNEVRVKIKIGKYTKDFEDHEDVINM